MELIERDPCENRRAADERKRELQDALDATLNGNRAFTSPGEKVEQRKKYPKNPEYVNKYLGDNSEVSKIKATKNKVENKAAIDLRNGAEITCEVCGKVRRRGDARRHRKSSIHMAALSRSRE